MKAYYLFFLAAFTNACQNQTETSKEIIDTGEGNPSLSLLWETDAEYPTNESALYSEDQGIIYLSCIAGNPLDKDQKGHIARLDTSGAKLDSAWARGFNAPKGMCIFQDRLYFTDIDRLISVALANPRDRLMYPVPGSVFLNDLTAGQRGLYMSDMKTGKLHYFESGFVHTINEQVPGLNGLAYFEDQLYALSEKGLLKLSQGGAELETVNSQVTGGDGLICLGNNRFIASRWQGEIWYVDGEQAILLLDSKEQQIQTADIDYDAERQILYVPRFFSNKLSAYRLNLP